MNQPEPTTAELLALARQWPRELEGNLINELADVVVQLTARLATIELATLDEAGEVLQGAVGSDFYSKWWALNGVQHQYPEEFLAAFRDLDPEARAKTVAAARHKSQYREDRRREQAQAQAERLARDEF